MGQDRMMRSGVLFVGFIFLFLQQELVSAEAQSEFEASRKPKLFYVTTKSSTSTISTFSICFVSSNAAATTCKRRKKRAGLNSDPILEQEPDITPSEVQSGLENEQEERNARFLVYWPTTTSFSTVYSATSTLASLTCTPANFPYSLCGK